MTSVFSVALKALILPEMYWFVSHCSVGGASFCLDYAWRYASERQQFGQPIGAFQSSQFKLADMATSVEASRALVRGAAAALDSQSPRATLASAMAKRFATDTCFGVANDALQLLGGYGYLQVCVWGGEGTGGAQAWSWPEQLCLHAGQQAVHVVAIILAVCTHWRQQHYIGVESTH